MATDTFGITMLNPTKSGGRVWNSNWHTASSHSWKSNGTSSQNRDPSDNEVDLHCQETANNGSPNKATTTQSTGILKAEGGAWRIYINDPNGNLKWQNVEMTVYYRVLGLTPQGGVYVHCRLSGRSEHQDEYRCVASGHTAGSFEVKDDGTNQLKKELVHPAYADNIVSHDKSAPKNVWVGMKLIVKNVSGNVLVQGYRDTTDGNGGGSWTKILEKLDSGNWLMTDKEDLSIFKSARGGAGTCTKVASENAKLLDPASSCYLRMDNTTVEFKKFSIREITGDGTGTQPGTGPPNTPPGTSKGDRFGIPPFYPLKAGGFVYEMSDDPKGDENADWPDEMDFGGNGVVTMSPSGPTDFGLGKNIKGFGSKNTIGGCNMDFKETAARGYAYKKDDVRDIELKCLAKFPSSLGDHGFSISACTGRHSSSGCCSGFAYMITTETASNPAKFRFRKEMWHVSYHTSPEGDFSHPKADFKIQGHGWVGLGFVRYNKKVGDDEQVVLELWFNPNPDDNIRDWSMLKRIVDYNGNGWGDDGDKCGGVEDQAGTWSSCQNRFKTNATSGKIDFKAVSLREINPFGATEIPAGEPVPLPAEGAIFRDWIVKYNLVIFPENICGTGVTPGTLTPFYNVVDNGSSSNLHMERFRVCMVANGSASKFVGKKPKRVRVMLSKNGNPPPGAITCVLRKGNTDDEAVTFAYTGGATLDATALSTTKTQYTFENLTTNYTWQIGDRLCVEYSGNDADVTNDINVFRSTDNPYDGVNSCAIKFDTGGPPPEGYSAADTGRDYAWEISE